MAESAFGPAAVSSESFLDPAELLEEHGGLGMPVLALYAAVGGMTVLPVFVETVGDWLRRVRSRFGHLDPNGR
ncbi:MAG TPA: hypothetical protein VKA86_00070 [Candidatus Krumholzibacteria bacterium]|nr:hypothetical protein [Candidatus Krumholzibacteria bacterium]